MPDSDRLMTNAQLSVLYYMRDKLVDNGWLVSGTFSGIATFMTAFPTEEDVERIVAASTGNPDEIILPVIALDDNNYIKRPTGIGGDDDESHYQLLIMIFAEDDSQRRALSQQIYDSFYEQGIDLDDFEGGYPPDVVPSGYGTISFDNVVMSPFRIPGSPNVADRHRANVSFDAVVYESN